MFLKETITILTKGIKDTFNEDYPEVDFRNLYVSHEYPIDRQNYPGIWVDFRPTGSLRSAGVKHQEFEEVFNPNTGISLPYRQKRWRFTGYAEFTVAALTSLERARLFDEMIKVVAFGNVDDTVRSTFRNLVEDNGLIAINGDFDALEQSGFAATPGTPWGSDDIIYEATLRMQVVGEFISDPSNPLLPLAAVETTFWEKGQTDPTTGGGWI